jgi:hypothetical protein
VILPEHNDERSLADQFNEYFLEKPLKLRASLQTSIPHITDSDSIVKMDSFRLLTVFQVVRIIKQSPRKSSVLDPIPTQRLLMCLKSLVLIIHPLVNSSLRDGMPLSYKSSIITPLIKKKNLDKNELSNYRPVSNLPFLSKIIERAVYYQLSNHLEDHGMFDPKQSAYRSLHSVEALWFAC